MFVSKEQIKRITGYVTSAAQIMWLKHNGIAHFVDGNGDPVIAESVVDAYLNSDHPPAEKPIPMKTDILNGAGAKFKLNLCGIYFLMHGRYVVYIGQTKNLFQRIAAHQSTDKMFDSFVFLPVERKMLNIYEQEYIAKHKPKYNISLNHDRQPRTPLRKVEKLPLETKPVLEIIAEQKTYDIPVFLNY